MSSKQDDFTDDFDDSEEEGKCSNASVQASICVSGPFGSSFSGPDFKPKSKSQRINHKKPSQKVINLGPAGGSTKKKPTRRPDSASPRTRSASTSIARQLWKNALNSTEVSAGSTKKVKKPAVEYWNESLRRTGLGLSTGSSQGSISGLNRHQAKDMAYSSTSHYLRQLVGVEKPKRSSGDPQAGRHAPGTPAYKSPEEYYDEILALKKQIGGLSTENSTMKSKVRRLEEDNLKKEREIEQLLDPSKSDELRRTLADRKPDAGAVIHSLKQKIMKLEHQLKDRESAFARLQSDLKTTKVEEMKLQLDTFYKEIVRLNQLKSVDGHSSRKSKEEHTRGGGGTLENSVKMKALQETILRMNEKNVRLTTENKTLKQDMERLMEEAAKSRDTQKEYEDMSKKQLLQAIGKLEKRLDRSDADSISLLSDVASRHDAVQGKITLEGSVAQRLDQLDQRETELLQENEKQRGVIKRLKDDRVHYRKKAEDKDKEIKALRKEVDDMQAELDSLYERDRNQPTPRVARRQSASLASSTPTRRGGRSSPQTRSRSPSVSSDAGNKREERERQRRIEQFREDTAARHIQRNWRSHRQRRSDESEQEEAKRRAELMTRAESLREQHAAQVIQHGWRHHRAAQAQRDEEERAWRAERDRRVEQFAQERAARRIQSGWINHQGRRREAEVNDATEFIQSALRGHLARKQRVQAYRSRPPSRSSGYADRDDTADTTSVTESVTGSELDSAAEFIQANIRGHASRREQLRRSRLQASGSDTDDAITALQSTFRGHLARKEQCQRLARQADLDSDDAIVTIQSAFRSHLARSECLYRERLHRNSSRSPSVSRRGGVTQDRHRLDSAGEEEDEEDDKYSSFSRGSRRSTGRDSRSSAKKPPLSPRKLSRALADDDDDDSDDDLIVTSSRGRVF